VEFTILFPILVTLLFAGPQLGMLYFAHEAAESAAQAGARAASARGAAGGAGSGAADSYLATLGTGTVSSYRSAEVDAASTVSVTVHVEVPNAVPLPGFHPSLDVTVVRATERFTTPDAP